MKKHLCTLAGATLLTVTLGGSQALAAVLFGENEKNYAGSSCQPATSVDSDRVRYLTGTARNTSTSAVLSLECPIIKDEYNSQVNSGRVVVVDRRDNDRVSCVFRSLRALDGAALTTVATKTVTTDVDFADSKAKHLTFSGLADPGDFGYYSMDCRVPAALPGAESMIINYNVDED